MLSVSKDDIDKIMSSFENIVMKYKKSRIEILMISIYFYFKYVV